MHAFKISHLFGRWINILLGIPLRRNEFRSSQARSPICKMYIFPSRNARLWEPKWNRIRAMISNLTASRLLFAVENMQRHWLRREMRSPLMNGPRPSQTEVPKYPISAGSNMRVCEKAWGIFVFSIVRPRVRYISHSGQIEWRMVPHRNASIDPIYNLYYNNAFNLVS